MIVSILIGLTLILSTFISTVSIVQKIAYAQARMPSSNGVPIPNPVTSASTVAGRNSAVQGVAAALSSVHMTSAQHPIAKIVNAIKYLGSGGFAIFGILKYKQHMDNCQMGMGPCVCQIHTRLC
jgi:hypothetical protein